jgi:hypothetical protein
MELRHVVSRSADGVAASRGGVPSVVAGAPPFGAGGSVAFARDVRLPAAPGGAAAVRVPGPAAVGGGGSGSGFGFGGGGGSGGSSTAPFAVLLFAAMSMAAMLLSRLILLPAHWRPVHLVSLIERPG